MQQTGTILIQNSISQIQHAIIINTRKNPSAQKEKDITGTTVSENEEQKGELKSSEILSLTDQRTRELHTTGDQ